MTTATPPPLDPAPAPARGVTVGHAHLRVSDLERAVAFYRDALGLSVMQRFGERAAFLSADGYHHHLALNDWESRGRGPAPRDRAGLFHVAFRYPDRAALARAVARLRDAGVRLTGAADHGVSEAVYLDDPDENGLELYVDRAPGDWPLDADGRLAMTNAPLDVEALLAAAEP